MLCLEQLLRTCLQRNVAERQGGGGHCDLRGGGWTSREAMLCSLRMVTPFQLLLETPPTNVLRLWVIFTYKRLLKGDGIQFNTQEVMDAEATFWV